MIPIDIATEDVVSEALARRLVAEHDLSYCIEGCYVTNGNGKLRTKMPNYCEIARRKVMLVITDLDRTNCVVEFRKQWLANLSVPPHFVFRVAVREAEAWLLADHDAMRDFLRRRGALPQCPDELHDPKRELLQLALRAPKAVREDLVRTDHNNIRQGIGYNDRLAELVRTQWSPSRAAERSPSLQRARHALRVALESFRG